MGNLVHVSEGPESGKRGRPMRIRMRIIGEPAARACRDHVEWKESLSRPAQGKVYKGKEKAKKK